MEKEIVFVLLDDFADWEAAFLAPALRAGTMPGRPASYGVKYMTPDANIHATIRPNSGKSKSCLLPDSKTHWPAHYRAIYNYLLLSTSQGK